MNELRFDPCHGEWVIISPRRGQRPGAPGARRAAARPPAWDPGCPFCPGNERETPPPVYEKGEPGRWRVRVISNRFPAVGDVPAAGDGSSLPGAAEEGGEALFLRRPAQGAHEVVVESPRHDREWPDMADDELAEVLAAYRHRYAALSARPDIAFVSLFRNQGADGGASQVHPHGQLIALPVVPALARRRWATAEAYWHEQGSCLYCRLAAAEERRGERWVFATESFAAFCPYAPRFPYEVWVMPRFHSPSFAALDEALLPSLARVLKAALGALRACADRPPFNLVLHDGPPLRQGASPVWPGHWFLQVAPRLTPLAGFELGTNMGIVTRSPEDAAAQLRKSIPEVRQGS